ncbi:hypothetical protein BKA56DRAFT_658042 [Ilyonectria sp. MPI-CAGE-AT-0026]|nr:hypothetical protein BKA56DRAFT_658042 [Ilyonectria sp. MPI-CAGE-AT-0026]
MSNLEADGPLPLFISSNQASSPFFYFHHIINAEDASLTVQVIGPNLEFTFTHSRARGVLNNSNIEFRLAAKTVGFLALVTPTGERAVLTSAESGHGAGPLGDFLDAAPGVLANLVWTKRVIAVGKLLGLIMARPFDNPGRVRRGPGRDGLFQGSHVEVKLAVHGIMVLLDMFNITKDFDNVTMRHLQSLRNARWENGTRPSFEVYFSRKNCLACGGLVRRLSEATGILIKLMWKHRLELKQYPRRTTRFVGPGRPQEEPEAIDDQDLDFGDELSEDESDSDTVGGEEREDLQVIPMVDLISHPSFSPSPAPGGPADDYIDGLAYRVGQMESSPDGAAEAIVQFAQKMQGRDVQWVSSQQSSSSINKPLPATPEIDPPAWMMARERQARSPPSPSSSSESSGFLGRSRSPSPCERAAVRDRSLRKYTTGSLSRTVLRRPRSCICVEIPARRRSA